MMKLRLSLRNSVKAALNSLIAANVILLLGCSPPAGQSYTIKNLTKSLAKICKDEYNIPIVSKLKGLTLWIYIPLEEEFFIDSEKPQENTKKFKVESVGASLAEGGFNFNYGIQEIPEAKERQNKKFNPEVSDKINEVLRSVRRVTSSIQHHKDEPKFFCIVTADIKNGVELTEITYVDDLKKAYYGIISWTEYQHRSLQDIKASFEAIGDTKGRHLEFQDIDFKDFLTEQIKQRIRSKFSRPEVEKGANIDREVLKSIKNVLEIYNFKDFLTLNLENLLTDNKTSLSRAAVFEKIKE